jgi:hypothetical protein
VGLGTFQHTALVVVGETHCVERIHRHAMVRADFELMDSPESVVNITDPYIGNNGHASFAILPSGGKQGLRRQEATDVVIASVEDYIRCPNVRGYASCYKASFGELGSFGTVTTPLHQESLSVPEVA